MSVKTPKQSPDEIKTFGSLLKQHMKQRKVTQTELANLTGISRSTIGRIIANKDHRGSTYRTTERMIEKISLALKLGEQLHQELCDLAFPEKKIIRECIAKKVSIVSADIELENAGLPTLFDYDEE